MQNHQYVFLGGLHRSGTSLLAKTLAEHPQISGFKDTGAFEDEGQWLQSVYPQAKVYGGAGRFGFVKASFMDENSDLVSAENAQRLFDEWKPYWDMTQPVLLEKSPPNLVRGRFLQAMFPNSFFIMMLRHPISVSCATAKWSNTSMYSLIEHWLRCHEGFERDRKYLQNVIVIKYENFVVSPQKTLDLIFEFIGVDSFPLSTQINSHANQNYFIKWRQMKHEQGWLKNIYCQAIENIFEKRVNRFGYSLKDLEQVHSY